MISVMVMRIVIMLMFVFVKVRLGSEEEHRLWDARDKELVPALEQEVRNNIIVRCCTLSQTSN